MNEIKEYTDKIFEDIKHIDENSNEYWLARELMPVLEYKEWRKFDKVIEKAIYACNGSNYYTLDHFVLEDKMVSIGSNTTRKIQDYKLSRYACYLIVQNCNPRIKIIALAQTYFAIQTRKQELSEKEYSELTEDELINWYIKEFYNLRLKELNPNELMDTLKQNFGEEIILLCHEFPGLEINKEHFCHRRLLADWIELETGIIIPELSISESGIITTEEIYDLKPKIKKLIKNIKNYQMIVLFFRNKGFNSTY